MVIGVDFVGPRIKRAVVFWIRESASVSSGRGDCASFDREG